MKSYKKNLYRHAVFAVIFTLLVVTLGGVAPVLAADNVYSENTNILLATPNYTLTIQASSRADTLIVGGTYFTVTVAAGDTFTVRSSDRLVLNNSTGIDITCASAYSELVITGAKTITVTPSGTICATATTVESTTYSSSGGGGGGGAPVTPITEEPQPAVPVVKTKATPLSGLTLGTLLKLSCPANADVNHACKAVYYYGPDGKRRPFPNEKTYFSWYNDFNDVKTISAETMAQISLAKAVTYRPGVKLVKFQTLNKVYAVSSDGLLRWVQTEELAKSLYGTDWNKKIDDISDAFYVNYKFGSDIKTIADYTPGSESTAVKTIDTDMGY